MIEKMLKALPPDQLAKAVLSILPPLPSDGNPCSTTPTRVALRKILALADFPLPVKTAATKYLEQASDTQLEKLSLMIVRIADELPITDAERNAKLELVK